MTGDELYCKRDAIELTADPGDNSSILVGQLGVVAARHGALHEQLDSWIGA